VWPEGVGVATKAFRRPPRRNVTARVVSKDGVDDLGPPSGRAKSRRRGGGDPSLAGRGLGNALTRTYDRTTTTRARLRDAPERRRARTTAASSSTARSTRAASDARVRACVRRPNRGHWPRQDPPSCACRTAGEAHVGATHGSPREAAPATRTALTERPHKGRPMKSPLRVLGSATSALLSRACASGMSCIRALQPRATSSAADVDVVLVEPLPSRSRRHEVAGQRGDRRAARSPAAFDHAVDAGTKKNGTE